MTSVHYLILITVFVILIGVLLMVVFKHATNDRAYVRTGYGDEIIALNTGVFVLPLLHHVVPVNLKTIRLEIELIDEFSVLTKDYMKVDLSIDFYVKLTLFPEQLKSFLSSQLIHAIRKVAAEITMADIHHQQGVFVEKIQQAVTGDLSKNSLQVDQVTLKNLDQSAKKYYSADNAFDAEGLSCLTKIIQNEKQTRYEIEQQHLLETKQKDLEMEKLIIEMENKKSRLRSEQKREFEIFKAANELAVSQESIKKHNEKKQANILAEQELEIFKHKSEITVSANLREKLKQQIETDLIKAEAVKAEAAVSTARKLEKADSQVKIKLLKEKRKREYETAKIIETAAARKKAAYEDADALRILAEGEADKIKILENSKLEAEKLIENNLKNKYQNEAEGLKILIDAISSLSKSELPRDVYPKLIEFFTALCLEDIQSMNKFGFIEHYSENNLFDVNPVSTKRKRKSTDTVNDRSKTKLQAILDDARNSLSEEALNTINDIGHETSSKFLQD
jgi:uncharacterized membrane protein YqiK